MLDRGSTHTHTHARTLMELSNGLPIIVWTDYDDEEDEEEEEEHTHATVL